MSVLTNSHPLAPDLLAIASRFALAFPPVRVELFGRGLINDSFRVEAGGRRYLLQRINGAVFPDPPRIMANIRALDQRVCTLTGLGFRVPALIPTREGAACLRDEAGAWWRLSEFIEETTSLEVIAHPGQACEVGRLLGRFHSLIQSLPLSSLSVSLPGFHDTPAYLTQFLSVVEAWPARAGTMRAGSEDGGAAQADQAFVNGGPDVMCVEDSVRALLERSELATCLSDPHASGRIPMRVTHGDPKLDNVLFDRSGGHAIALVDLDTLQPGLILHDIGDCLRSCCNRRGESPNTLDRVYFDLVTAEAILSAYANEVADWLSDAEVLLVGEAIRLMPYELALRFLTDHLVGDRYFKVMAHGDNLRKAAVQLALLMDIENKDAQIKSMLARCFQ